MPTILVPNTVMLELVYTWQNQRIENVYHVKCAGVPSAADVLAIKNVGKAWEYSVGPPVTGFRTMRNNQTTLVEVKATSLHAIPGPVSVEAIIANGVGSQAGTNVPAYVAVVVKWTTGLSGRSYRGRSYWPGLNYANLDPVTGRIFSTAQANYVTEANRLLSMLTTAGYTLVVASKYFGVVIINGYRRAVPRAEGITTPVLSANVDNVPGTRRSRKVV